MTDKRLLAAMITDHLIEISSGTCSINDELIESKSDPVTAEILAGLLFLHEELCSRREDVESSESLLHTVFDHIPIMITVYDAEGHITLVNRAVEKDLGWSLDEWRSRNILAECYPHQADRQRVIEFMMHPKAHWETFATRTRSGEIRRTSWFNVRLDDGQCIGIGQDVTESQRLSTELETLVEHLPDMVFVKDAKTLKFVRLNAAAEALIGLPREQLFGKSDYDFFPREQADFFTAKDREVLQSKKLLDIPEEPLNTANGVRTLHTKKIPLLGPDGQPRYLLGISRDITEEKHVMQAVRRMAAVVESTDDAIITTDTRAIITSWNTAAQRMFGFSAKEAIGKAIGLVSPDVASSEQNEVVAKVLTGEKLYNLQTKRRHKNGKLIDVSMTISPLLDHQGRSTGASAIIRDITKTKETETALRRATDEATKANHAKSEFLANMSHEIRTPMNGVIGMTSLLSETNLDAEQREQVETIEQSAKSLLLIINDILDLSKIEAKKLSLEELDFQLRSSIDDAVQLHATAARNKGIELACLIDGSVHDSLRGDPGRLRQVLTNLLSNAIKFTQEGEVTLKVCQIDETSVDTLLRFEIRDTGIGMAPEVQDRVFDAFAQADSTTTRRFGGTGLGLAISKQLTSMMGGEIGVESVEGEGSTFWFTARLKKIAGSVLRTRHRAQIQGIRALVVDDHELSRMSLVQILNELGLDADFAPTGSEALTKLLTSLTTSAYQMVLTEKDLDGMDGPSLVRAIRAIPQLKDIHTILLSSNPTRGDGMLAKEIQADGYLPKPVRRSKLASVIEAVFIKRSSGAEMDIELVTQHTAKEIADRSKQRILVAEDNIVNQKVVCTMLERLGASVDVVSDGKQAVAAIAKTPYKLILMDCQMPILDGYKATEQIRSMPEPCRSVPIIAMTASAMAEDRKRCLAAGMNDHVSKPIELPDVQKILDRYSGDGLD